MRATTQAPGRSAPVLISFPVRLFSFFLRVVGNNYPNTAAGSMGIDTPPTPRKDKSPRQSPGAKCRSRDYHPASLGSPPAGESEPNNFSLLLLTHPGRR